MALRVPGVAAPSSEADAEMRHATGRHSSNGGVGEAVQQVQW